MKDRILKFLQSENKSNAQFAEEIGVQPSGISHIISGRNNPSLDFILKMLQKYPSLSAEWLLFGRGSMYKYVTQPSLFDELPVNQEEHNITDDDISVAGHGVMPDQESDSGERTERNSEIPVQGISDIEGKRLERVLLFYSDRTFSEYRPG